MKNKIFVFCFTFIMILSSPSSFLTLKAAAAVNITLPNNNIVSNTNDYHMPIQVSNLAESKLILHISLYKNDFLYASDDIRVDKNGYLDYIIKAKEFKATDKIKVEVSYRYRRRNHLTRTEFEILDGKAISTIKVSSLSVLDCIPGQSIYLPIKISYLDKKNNIVNKYRNQDISLQLTDHKTFEKVIRVDKKASASKISIPQNKDGKYIHLKPLNTNIDVIPAKIRLNHQKDGKLKNITLPNKEVTIDVGEVYTVNPIMRPQSFDVNDIHWSSSRPDIASVDSYGHVTGKKTGEADIKLSYEGIIIKMKVNVKKRLKEILFPEKKLYIESGKSITLDYRMDPIDADISKIDYETDDFMIAEMKGKKIIANRPGTTNITVTADNVVGKLDVEVIPPLQIINKNKEELSMTTDDDYQIKYDVSPSTYRKHVKMHFSSDDDKIAKVSHSGKITPISSGSTVIRAVYDTEQSFSIKITVLSGKDDIKLKTDTLHINSGDSIDMKDYIDSDFNLAELKISCECKSVSIDGTLIKAEEPEECPVILNHKGTTKILNLKISTSQDTKESNVKFSTNKKDEKKEKLKDDKHPKLSYAGIIVVFVLLSILTRRYVKDKNS